MPHQTPASSSKPTSDSVETTKQTQEQQTSAVPQPGSKDPTSFVLPNPIPNLFPFYWLSILLWRGITDRFPPFSRRRERAELVLDGIEYGEAPRIRDGKVLYFVDMHRSELYSLDLESRRVVNKHMLAAHASKISGLGWLPAPDSRLLVVSMENFKLLAVNQKDDQDITSVCELADLSNFARKYINDMCVDTAHGVAFVGNFGFDISKMWDIRATTLACVQLDSSVFDDQEQQQEDRVKPVARDMLFPNGMVVTPDGRTLIVAETLRATLTAFDLPPVHEQRQNGQITLTNRRTWAYVGVPLDGICLDSAGRVWAAVPCIGMMRALGGAVRVNEGGHIDAMVGFGANGLGTGVVACNLYTTAQGEHRLVVLTAKTTMEEEIKAYHGRQNGALYTIKVDCGPAKREGDDTYHAGYC